VLVPNADFVAVSAGYEFSLGLKSDGSIVAWGRSGVPIPNSDFIAVSGGNYHSLGLKSDGSIVAWGENYYGQTNVPSPNTGFVAVAGGVMNSFGLKSDGSIIGWGASYYGDTDVPSPNAGFVAMAAGLYFSMGLKSDGSIVAWGYNGQGQCNVPTPNSAFVALAAGHSHSLGLKSDGRIIGWGDNDDGQINVPSPNTDFVAVAARGHHSLGLKSDGGMVAWGIIDEIPADVPLPNVNFGQLSGVVPPGGPTAGGTRVTILGSQLGNGSDVTNVMLCGVVATIVTQNTSRVVVQTGPAPIPTNGDVVVYSTSYGSILRTNSFTYGNLPIVVTRPVTNITAISVIGVGEVLSDGGDARVEYGLCWAATTNPTISDFVAAGGTGTGVFANVAMTGLSPGTLSHVRAWAINIAGVVYGADVLFRTRCVVTASAGQYGTISPNGTVDIEYGSNVTFAITPDTGCRVADVLIDGGSVGITNSYTFENVTTNHTIGANFAGISGIAPVKGPLAGGTTITILGSNLGNGTNVTNVTLCGVAAMIITQDISALVVQTGPAITPTNGDVVVYSMGYGSISLTNGFTYYDLPTVVTHGVTNVTATSAVSGGEVLSDGGDTATARGLCWGATTNPTMSDFVAMSRSGTGVFEGVVMTNLSPGTLYHVRAWACNAVGVTYGADVLFMTHYTVTASAGLHGTIFPNGIVGVEYGSNIAFAITSNPGWHIRDVLVDSVSVGVTNSYTFIDVMTNHTIRANFAADDGRWRFTVLSDTASADMTSNGIVAEIAQAIASEEPDLMIFCGDLQIAPSLAGFQQWTNVMAPLYQAGIDVYPIRGNHEASDVAIWTGVFSYLPTNGPTGEVGLTYSVSNMNAVFLGMDENVNSKRVNQSWLNTQLAANTGQHIFVFGHMPAFPTGSHIGSSLDAYPTDRNSFWSSLAASGVKAYFCGHEEFYDHARADNGDGNRTNDVHQYIIGTSGSAFDSDSGYVGNNGSWIPVRRCHTNQNGYVMGEVYGNRVTLTWKGRTSPGVYQAGESLVFGETYTTNGIPQSWLDYYGLTNDLTDADSDGMPEWAECIAGTDPTDPASRLYMNIGQVASDVLLSWSNTGSRTYQLWFCPDLVTGSWQGIGAYTNLPSGTTWYTNNAPTNAAFFRVTVVNTNL